MQNYNTIITQIQLRCKLNIFHIKTSKIEKTHHLYKKDKYIFYVIFTL